MPYLVKKLYFFLEFMSNNLLSTLQAGAGALSLTNVKQIHRKIVKLLFENDQS